MINIFNRSHYEDVLIVRVKGLVPESVWRPRYEAINQFEYALTMSGITVIKFYLHISKDEQKRRLEGRLANPDKRWKFSANDLKERVLWEDYQAAFEEAINNCATSYAPWYVIPTNIGLPTHRDYQLAARRPGGDHGAAEYRPAEDFPD
jgi:polyphosphate kinase 2 (PPK2 family)